MSASPEKNDDRKAPLKVPKEDPANDGFPAEKDVSEAPPGTDQSESTSPPGRPKKED